MPPKSTQAPLTDEEISQFRAWLQAGSPKAAASGEDVRDYEALTHLSVHRDREPGEVRGMAGADLVMRGSKVSLDKERAERLLGLGAIRPWEDKEGGKEVQYPRARDMTGKAFPAMAQVSDADVTAAKQAAQEHVTLTGQPEGSDPQPTGEQPPPPAPSSPPVSPPDPYA